VPEVAEHNSCQEEEDESLHPWLLC
jgi:hypothetical protein